MSRVCLVSQTSCANLTCCIMAMELTREEELDQVSSVQDIPQAWVDVCMQGRPRAQVGRVMFAEPAGNRKAFMEDVVHALRHHVNRSLTCQEFANVSWFMMKCNAKMRKKMSDADANVHSELFDIMLELTEMFMNMQDDAELMDPIGAGQV